MKVSNKKSILHNKYILYFIFFIALSDLLILGYNNDYYSVAIFILIGFLTSFFSKNMIVIMLMAIAFTNIILIYGRNDRFEGMTTEKTDEEKTDEEKTDEEKTDEEKTDEEKTNKKKTDKKKKKKESDENTDENGILSVETNESSNKEKFEQDKNVVYTSEEDKELDKTDKMVISQEKILKSMNKYKPLLDTLQGITKNMAIVKGAASSD
jgi:trehalose/maltose hydrolase-like predicted phosphorylase